MDDNKPKMNIDLYRGVTGEQHDTMDYRHPEMYRDSVTEATKVAIQWFETYSQRNPDGMK